MPRTSGSVSRVARCAQGAGAKGIISYIFTHRLIYIYIYNRRRDQLPATLQGARERRATDRRENNAAAPVRIPTVNRTVLSVSRKLVGTTIANLCLSRICGKAREGQITSCTTLIETARSSPLLKTFSWKPCVIIATAPSHVSKG